MPSNPRMIIFLLTVDAPREAPPEHATSVAAIATAKAAAVFTLRIVCRKLYGARSANGRTSVPGLRTGALGARSANGRISVPGLRTGAQGARSASRRTRCQVCEQAHLRASSGMGVVR